MKRYLFLMICCFIAVNGMSQTFRIGGVSRDSIAIFGLKNNILKLGIIADTVPISKKIVIENISEEPIDLYSIIPTKGCLKFNYQKGIIQPKVKRIISFTLDVNMCLQKYSNISDVKIIDVNFYTKKPHSLPTLLGIGFINMDIDTLWEEYNKKNGKEEKREFDIRSVFR